MIGQGETKRLQGILLLHSSVAVDEVRRAVPVEAVAEARVKILLRDGSEALTLWRNRQ